MIRKRYKKKYRKKDFIKANHYIRFPEVRVLTDRGEMIGVMPTSQAVAKARAQEKDLVLVTENAKPPVAKIIELSKYKYQQQQKHAEGRKKARSQEIKEVRLTPFMGENDFKSRLKKIITFLEKGNKVRLTLAFRGRQITKKEFGYDLFSKVFEKTQEIAEIEIQSKMIGRKLIAQLSPLTSKKTN